MKMEATNHTIEAEVIHEKFALISDVFEGCLGALYFSDISLPRR